MSLTVLPRFAENSCNKGKKKAAAVCRQPPPAPCSGVERSNDLHRHQHAQIIGGFLADWPQDAGPQWLRELQDDAFRLRDGENVAEVDRIEGDLDVIPLPRDLDLLADRADGAG